MSDFVVNWKKADVCQWLRNVNLGRFAEFFFENEIDGVVLLSMTEMDVCLPPLSFERFGDIRRFGLALEQLKLSDSAKKYLGNGSTSVIQNSFPENIPGPSHVNILGISASGDIETPPLPVEEIPLTVSQNNITDDGKCQRIFAVESGPYEILDEIGDVVETNDDRPEEKSDHDDDRQSVKSYRQLESSKANVTRWLQLHGDVKPNSASSNVDESFASILSDAERRALRDQLNRDQFSKEALMTERLKNPTPRDAASVAVIAPSIQVRVYKSNGYDSSSYSGRRPYVAADRMRPTQNALYCSSLPKSVERWSDGESAFVSHVESPALFYVMSGKNKDAVVRHRERMNKFYADHPIAPIRRDALKLGMPCVARYSVDNELYRGEIRAICENDECEIYFVDFGNFETMRIDQIRPLVKEFGKLGPMCVPCSLDGLTTPTASASASVTFSEEIVGEFEKIVQPWTKMWIVKFVGSSSSADGPSPVAFYDPFSVSYVQNMILKALGF